MDLVDSHCHLNFPPLIESLDQVLDEAKLQGITHMLCASVNLEDFPQILQLARQYDHIFCSVGVHPNETDGEDPTIDRLVALGEDPAIVAIGETGLDYFRSQGDLTWQRQRFGRHIKAAVKLSKPLIVHSRDAEDDTVNILREHGAGDATGVLHCFTGDWEMAKKVLDLGFYISFSGIVTFNSAIELREVATKMPLDRMLVETDSPYLAPVPHRGKPNQPAYVRHVLEFLSELLGISDAKLSEITSKNFFDLFPSALQIN